MKKEPLIQRIYMILGIAFMMAFMIVLGMAYIGLSLFKALRDIFFQKDINVKKHDWCKKYIIRMDSRDKAMDSRDKAMQRWRKR